MKQKKTGLMKYIKNSAKFNKNLPNRFISLETEK